MGCMHSSGGCFVRQRSKMAEVKAAAAAAAKSKVKKMTYTCEICGQEDLTENDMRSHVLIEHVEGEISCPFCDLEGTSVEEMNLHVNMEHLDFLSAQHGSGSGSDVAMETVDSGNYSSLESNVSSRSDTSKQSSDTYRSYSSASTAVAPTQIRITEVQESPDRDKRNLDTKGDINTYSDQSLKRARLYLDVPTSTGYNNGRVFNSMQTNNNSNCSDLDTSSHNLDRQRTSPENVFSCPMCSWITDCPDEISRHVNVQHLDALTPSKGTNCKPQLDSLNNVLEQEQPSTSGLSSRQFECPICGSVAEDGSALEEHVNSRHVDILSPANSQTEVVTPMSVDTSSTGSNQCLCPVCGMGCGDADSLAMHVDGHFSSDHTPEAAADNMLAQEIDRRERQALRLQEEREFEKLQEMYGMKGNNNYKKQAERTLERAVNKGQMTVSDYYSKKLEVQQSSTLGIDDGHSATKGIIPKLKHYFKTYYVSQHWLCTPLDHFAASYGDKGWGCGYRNLQMLLSCLAQNPTYQQVLFNGRPMIPSIPKIQRLIEAAWQKGFDRQGSEQLGGKVVDTTKWIGATEIVATLSSLRVKCQLVDFHAPTGKNGTHPRLFEWVKAYFQRDTDFKPPLYLQHQGHSRTIVGIEELRDGSLRLLLFDPSCNRKQMQQFIQNINANLMRSLRRNPNSMKARQYQIVAVDGELSEKEYEESKSLNSERIP